jgi:hypothetical protein
MPLLNLGSGKLSMGLEEAVLVKAILNRAINNMRRPYHDDRWIYEFNNDIRGG